MIRRSALIKESLEGDYFASLNYTTDLLAPVCYDSFYYHSSFASLQFYYSGDYSH